MKVPRNSRLLRGLRGLYLKTVRQSGSPEYAARGVAIGLFIGLLIPFGLQLAVAIPLAFLCRASKVLAIAFTFVTNHFTIFFIYPVQCVVGSWLLLHPLSRQTVSAGLKGIFHADSFSNWCEAVAQMGAELAGAFFAGGLLFGVVAAVVGYLSTRHGIVAYRRHREERRAAKAAVNHSLPTGGRKSISEEKASESRPECPPAEPPPRR